ncbi:hypothetical protein BaRGS_00005161, partial [Batillaria attramentaria]
MIFTVPFAQLSGHKFPAIKHKLSVLDPAEGARLHRPAWFIRDPRTATLAARSHLSVA